MHDSVLRREAVLHEYAFDVKLWAVCRVTAATKEEALNKMFDVVDCIDIGYDKDGVVLTEASVGAGIPKLFELDGEAV